MSALATSLLLLAIAADPAGEARLRPSLGVALGYSTPFSYILVDCVGPGDCGGSIYAQGLGISVMAQALYGDSVSVGAHAEIGVTFGYRFGLATSVLGLVRFGRDTFLDLGGGVGYGWATRPSGDSSISRGEIGVAFALRAGFVVSESVALLVRGNAITGYPGNIAATVGLEWRL